MIIASAAKQTPAGWASRPSSFPRTRESSTGRDAGAYDLVAAGVPARHFLDPGSESGVTNDRQPPVPSGAVPPMGSLSLRNAEFQCCSDSMARVLGLVALLGGTCGRR